MSGSCRTYPKTGPRKGVKMKKHTTNPRFEGVYKSALVPAPILRGGEPKTPAKNRQTTRDAKVLEKPAPIMKSPNIGRQEK